MMSCVLLRSLVSKAAASRSSVVTTTACRWHAAAAAAAPASAASLSGGLQIKALKDENPYVNVVRYEHKNRTWTTHHVDYYSQAVAIGLVDVGLLPGDVVLNFMPDHWSETMVLQFACSKAGMVLYSLDSSLPAKDPELAKSALKKALALSKANVFVSPEAHNDFNYIRLVEQVLPELTEFDTSKGAQFIAPRYPHLRYCIQTGFEDKDKEGWVRMAHFVVPAGDLEKDWLRDYPAMTGSTPLLGQFTYDQQGVPDGIDKTLTNDQVIHNNSWDTYCKILKKEFHNVEGVGVVW